MKEDINQIPHKIIGCAMQVHRMLENGFGQVEVAPQPGALTRIDCSMPHPAGTIVVALRKKPMANPYRAALPCHRASAAGTCGQAKARHCGPV